MLRYIRTLLYLTVVSCLFFACRQQNKPMQAQALPVTDTTLKWVDYRIGELPPVNYYTAFDSVIKKWNLRYERIEGGCEALPEDRKVFEKDNAKYFKTLEQKFGKDWIKRFYAEVKTIDSVLDRKDQDIYK